MGRAEEKKYLLVSLEKVFIGGTYSLAFSSLKNDFKFSNMLNPSYWIIYLRATKPYEQLFSHILFLFKLQEDNTCR